jgi:hypothetical protein
LKDQIRKYNIGIATLQEIRWKGKGLVHSQEFTIIYSGEEENNFGTGFIIHDKYKHAILNYCNILGVLFTMELYCTPKSQYTTVKHSHQLFEHT